MKMLRATSLSIAGGLFLFGAGSVRADDCALALAASIAQAKTPRADTHETAMPGKPVEKIEMIFLTDKVYVQINGAWRSMAFSPQRQIDMAEAASKRAEKAPHSCQKVAGDAIDGEATSLLIAHTEMDGKTSDARLWISEKTGMPLKSEVRLSSGATVTDTFRYGDIQPPPGVK